MQARSPHQQTIANILATLHRGFDATATWVTKLSWWKFFLFAALSLIAASIVQEELFSGSGGPVSVRSDSKPRKGAADEPHIVIDDTGIRFNPRKGKRPVQPPEPPEAPAPAGAPEAPLPPIPPEAGAAASAVARADTADGAVHIELPPQIGEELSNAIEEAVDGMAERGFGRIVNITSGAVKAPIDVLGLSNGARSGLTGFIAGLARQARLAGNNVTVNNLLPGPFETERLHKTLSAAAEANGSSVESIAEQRRKNVPAQRFGQPDEFGAYCAFICGAQSGFLTGQNLLLDGGSYPGTF